MSIQKPENTEQTPQNVRKKKSKKKPRPAPKLIAKYAMLGVEQLESIELMSVTPLHETVSRLQAVMLGPVQASPDLLVTEAIASEADIRSGLMTMQLDLASRQETLIAAQNSYATTLNALTAARAPERELERLSALLGAGEAQIAGLSQLRIEVESLRQSVSTLETDEQKTTQAIQTLTTQKATLETELQQLDIAIAAAGAPLAVSVPPPTEALAAPQPTAPLSPETQQRIQAIEAQKADITRNMENYTIGITAIEKDIVFLSGRRDYFASLGDPHAQELSAIIVEKNTVLAPLKAQAKVWSDQIGSLTLEQQTLQGAPAAAPVVVPPPVIATPPATITQDPLSPEAIARLGAIDMEKADITRNMENYTIGITAIEKDIVFLSGRRDYFASLGDPHAQELSAIIVEKNTVLAPLKAQAKVWSDRIATLDAEILKLRTPTVSPTTSATTSPLLEQKKLKTAELANVTMDVAAKTTIKNSIGVQLSEKRDALAQKQRELEVRIANNTVLQAQIENVRQNANAAQPTIVRLTSELSVTQATVTRIQADIDAIFIRLSDRQQVLREATKIKEALIVAKNAPPSAQSPRQLSAFSQNVVHTQVSNIMGDLIPLGGGIGDIMDAIAEGKTHEEFEALTWNMFANALSSAAGANDGDVLDSIAGDLRVLADREQMEADIWNGVAGRVESLLFAEEHSSDSVALSGTALGDSNRMSLALALENLGGSISINSVNGALPLATDLSVMPGTDAARLLGQLDPNAPAPAALAPLSGVRIDPQNGPIDIGRTFTVPGLGSVLVHANNGQPWNYQQQGNVNRLLNIQNGAITSTSSREWWQTVTNFGTVLVRFQNGPQYVSAVSIKHIDATGNAQLKLTDENGIISYIPIDGSGSVKVDKILREFTLDNRGGTYGIENIDPRALVPDAEWEGIATVTKVDGAGTWLDFADAGQLVTEASGKIESTNPNDRITAYVYRGSTKVETIEIGAGGVWSVANDQGFSSIVFRHTNAGSTLFMGDLNVGTDGSPKNDAWTAADGSNNGDIARAQSRQWENSTVYKDVDGLNIYQINGMGGEEIVVSGQIRMEAGNDYPDEYQRLEYRGSPQVHRMLYVNENGLQVLPTSQYRVIAGNVIIIFPGAPRRIVTELWGNGKVTHPSYTKHGAEYNDVMPPVEPTLRADWLYWKEQGGNEGWTEIPSAVSTRRIVAVPGSTLGSLWSIHNDGLTGVDVTVNVHVGQTGTNADPIQRTFTGHIGGMKEEGLAVNVGIGQEKDVVTLEIIRSDGITMEYGRRTRAAQSHEIRVVNPTTGQLEWKSEYLLPDTATLDHIARLYERIGRDQNIPELSTKAQALRSATTPEQKEVAYIALTGLQVTIIQQQQITHAVAKEIMVTGEIDGIGGDSEEAKGFWQSMRETAAAESASAHLSILQGYKVSSERHDEIFQSDRVWSDSEVSQIMLGLAPMLRSYRSAPWSLARLATRVEQVLGIDAIRLYILADRAPDEQFENGLLLLCKEYGYDLEQPVTERVMDTELEYRPGIVRVHFNPKTLKEIDHVWVNLWHTDPAIQNLKTNIGYSLRPGQLFIDVPTSVLNNAAGTSLKTIIWWKGGTDATTTYGTSEIDRSKIVTDPGINNAAGDFSTLPESDPSHEIEKLILSRLQFPTKGGTWTNNMVSTAHHGSDLYALDLNLPGTADFGAEVFMPATGMIQSADLSKGSLQIIHILPDGRTWTTTLLHLVNILENVTGLTYEAEKEARDRLGKKYGSDPANAAAFEAELAQVNTDRTQVQQSLNTLLEQWKQEGKTFSTDVSIAGVGNEGASDGSHLHMRVMQDGKPVNLFAWADAQRADILSKGSAGGKSGIEFKWNETAMALSSASEGIAIRRENILNEAGKAISAQNIAYALTGDFNANKPETFVQIKWDAVTQAWYKADNETWTKDASGKRVKWTMVNDTFQFLPE